MGLGKTLMTIAMIRDGQPDPETLGHQGPTLIVAPTNVIPEW